jgi:hypothetical protein
MKIDLQALFILALFSFLPLSFTASSNDRSEGPASREASRTANAIRKRVRVET